MAANDELPRGLVLVSPFTGGTQTASVTFPATPGISWILTYAALHLGSGSGASADILLNINGVIYGEALLPSAPDSSADVAISQSIPFPVGVAVVVKQNSANPLNVGSLVTASAYPI